MIFVLAILALTAVGLVSWRIRIVSELPLAARLAVAFVFGLAINALLLSVESALGIAWSRAALWIPALVLISGVRRPCRRSGFHIESGGVAAALQIALLFYAAATARVTCGDLLFFWGPKAGRFAEAGKIDLGYLLNPANFIAHRDYPLLLPLTYVWGIIAARRMSWDGAVLLLPIFVGATAAVFAGFAARRIGARRAWWYAALMAAALACANAAAMTAGAADAVMVLFEVTALAALTFEPDDRGAVAVAAVALAACVYTKAEGAAFAAILIVLYAITKRRRNAIALAIPPALTLAAWLLLVHRYHAEDAYALGKPLFLRNTALTLVALLRSASYDSYYLPWVAALVPVAALRRNLRRAALPLAAALGVVASAVWFYIHDHADPLYWIRASADRVLISALASLLVATAAANE
jgi:hypothetical protein